MKVVTIANELSHNAEQWTSSQSFTKSAKSLFLLTRPTIYCTTKPLLCCTTKPFDRSTVAALRYVAVAAGFIHHTYVHMNVRVTFNVECRPSTYICIPSQWSVEDRNFSTFNETSPFHTKGTLCSKYRLCITLYMQLHNWRKTTWRDVMRMTAWWLGRSAHRQKLTTRPNICLIMRVKPSVNLVEVVTVVALLCERSLRTYWHNDARVKWCHEMMLHPLVWQSTDARERRASHLGSYLPTYRIVTYRPWR